MSKKKLAICAFCDRTGEQVTLLIKSQYRDIYICDDCTVSAVELVYALTVNKKKVTH